jgi:hypothetical protein
MYFIVVAAIAVALLVLGCGGGGSDSSTEASSNSQGGGSGENSGTTTAILSKPITSVPTSALTKAQFLKRADAACLKTRHTGSVELTAYLRRNKVGLEREEILPHVEEIYNTITLPAYEGQIDGIRSLGAPKGDEARIVAILDAMQKGAKEAGEDPAAFFFNTGGPLAHAYELARGYGLLRCATS